MPFLWTEGRFIMSHLEVPTLREIPAERRKTNLLMKSGVPGDSFIVSIVSAIFIFLLNIVTCSVFLMTFHICVYFPDFSCQALKLYEYSYII